MTRRDPPDDEPDARAMITIGAVIVGIVALSVAMYFGFAPS